MKTIQLQLSEKKNLFSKLKDSLGGVLKNINRETELNIDKDIAVGSIKGINLENGITFLEFDLTCNEDIKIVVDNSNKETVNFIYCSEGNMRHAFGNSNNTTLIEAFQTSIIANINSSTNTILFDKDSEIKTTLISVNVGSKYKTNSIKNKIKETFLTSKNEDFFYCGSHNIKILETIKQINSVDKQGVVRSLLINGLVNVVLALEIEQHDKDINSLNEDSVSLTKSEFEIIKEMSDYINNFYDSNLQINLLQRKSGLTAAKLQEGFKLMHGLTICEYVRSVRLTKAENLISKSELNISEIVYSLGFSSRSYFSKIFKEKFGCSPTTYKKQNRLFAISA